MANTNNERRIDLGLFTAYGEAVAAGYKGTKAEFEAGLAASADYANHAEQSAAAAEQYKNAAEEWATGGFGGTPGVDNNAAYFAGQAQNALSAAQSAKTAAETAQTGAEAARNRAETAAATFQTDKTLSVADKAADAAVVGTLKSAVIKNEINNNAFDILLLCQKHDETLNGISYKWNSDGTVCTLNPDGSATASAISRNNIYQNANGFPDGIKAGSTIRIMPLDVGDVNVYIRIFISTDGATFPQAAAKTVHTYSEYTIPGNATGIRIQIAVSANTTLNNLMIAPKILTETLTNEELEAEVKTAYMLAYKGLVDNNTDLDTLTEPGNYTLAGSRTYDNIPDEIAGKVGILEVIRPSNPTGSIIAQRITGDKKVFIRDTTNGALTGIAFTNVTADVGTREYTKDDMVKDHYLNMGSGFVTKAFNPNARAHSDSSYSWLFIPIKAGDSIYLKTSAGSINAKPYAIIKQNYIIDSIYTGGSTFTGTIIAEHDGFLAVNMLNSFAEKFRCAVTWDITATARDDLRLNASKWETNRQLPEYDDENVCKVIKTGQSFAAMLRHWAIIGASYDSGEFNYTVNNAVREIDWYEYSCWNMLKRMNGIEDMYLYCAGGQNAMDWISLGPDSVRGYAYDSDTEVVNPYWSGRSGIGHAGGCWWKMRQDYQSGNVKQVFVVNLGSNDINNNYPWKDGNKDSIDPNYDPANPNGKYLCGSIDDIGTYDLETDSDALPTSGTPSTTKQAVPGVYNSYCAYIGAILNRILAIQPQAIVLLCTIRNHFFTNDYKMSVWEEYNEALKKIASMEQYKDNVYILDNGAFGPNYGVAPMSSNIVYAHPNAFGYQYIAGYWNTLIDHCVQKNYAKMKQSMFIGTGKQYTSPTN